MKTIVILSDTHGFRRGIDEIEHLFAENDMVIHLGDTSADGNYIRTKFPAKTIVINGNCDLPALGDDEKVIEVENIKIFACHGHKFSVKTTLAQLAARAKELGCAVALYGHTHRARADIIDGVTLINPGAGSRYGERSYLYLVVSGDKFTYKTVSIG